VDNKYKRAFTRTDYIERAKREKELELLRKQWAEDSKPTEDWIARARQFFEETQRQK